MSIYASIAMTFIPLATVYICFLLLGEGFNKVHGALSCLCGLFALVPIELVLVLIHACYPFDSAKLTGRLVKGLLINGIVEESAKMAFLFLLPAKRSRLFAFFSYAVLCGLTLGCLETLIYLINGNRSITLRLFTAVVMHSFCAALSGLSVFTVKRQSELADKSFLWLPFVLAVLFHGLYNYFAGLYGGLHYFAFAVIAVTLLECKLRYQGVKIKFKRRVSVAPELTDQGDAKKMGFGFIKKLFGASEEKESAETTQVQESAQTVAEDDATMVDSNSTIVSDDDSSLSSSDSSDSSAVKADMSFAMHTSAELKSDDSKSGDNFSGNFAEALKIVDVFDSSSEEDAQPDIINVDEVFASASKAEKDAASKVSKAKTTAARKTATSKKTATAKAASAKKGVEKAEKAVKTTAKKTAAKAGSAASAAKKTAAATKKTAEKKVSATKKSAATKVSAAKKSTEKAVKATASAKKGAEKTAKATAKKATEKASASAKAVKKTAEKKVSAAKKDAAKTVKAAKKTAEKSTAKKASTTKKTATKKTK